MLNLFMIDFIQFNIPWVEKLITEDTIPCNRLCSFIFAVNNLHRIWYKMKMCFFSGICIWWHVTNTKWLIVLDMHCSCTDLFVLTFATLGVAVGSSHGLLWKQICAVSCQTFNCVLNNFQQPYAVSFPEFLERRILDNFTEVTVGAAGLPDNVMHQSSCH